MRGPVRLHFQANDKNRTKLPAIFVVPENKCEELRLRKRGYLWHDTAFGKVMQKGLNCNSPKWGKRCPELYRRAHSQ